MSDCRKCAKFEECAVDEDCGLFVDKPMTNADRIRTMTDEDLAEWLDNLINHCYEGPCVNCFMREACQTSMMAWLKSPEDKERDG